MRLSAGDCIGDFCIREVIANGGFSVVYLAHDRRLRRAVAIKQLSPEAFSEEGSRDWFIREAQLTASLAHPNIVQIYSLHEQGELVFLVMEYLPGDLLQLVRTHGPLDRDRFVAVANDICRALETLHVRDIIHRDIKPENILIGAEGQFKLADFGLAHVHPAQRLGLDDATGPQPGTLMYMSPEQALGQNVTPRSDIYALAVVLYEAATGRYYLDYDQKNDSDERLLQLIQHAAPLPFEGHDPSLPALVGEALNRALSKAPAQRPATARAFLADLKNAISRGKQLARVPQPREAHTALPAAISDELLRDLYIIRTLRDAQHQPELARDQMRVIWKTYPGVPQVAAEWGETLLAVGRIEEGRNWIESALRLEPNLPFAHLALARIYRDIDEDDAEADAAATTAIALDADLAYAVLYDEINAALADPAAFARYVTLFQRAAESAPSVAVLHNLGQVLALDRRFARQALFAFKQALTVDPAYGPASIGLANLLIDLDRLPQAIPFLEHARHARFPTLSPGDWHRVNTVYQPVHAHLALAIGYARLGHYESSAVAARAVIDLDRAELEADAPDLLASYAAAARTWLASGDPVRAYKFLNQIIPLAALWGHVETFTLLEEAQGALAPELLRPQQREDSLEWLRNAVTAFRRAPTPP